jgi:NAD(P)-dependent dehydrogenase (short-subunit alcohol dehydrogenase family)
MISNFKGGDPMASIDNQDLSVTKHHTLYDAIDPTSALKGSASDKVIFITGGSQGIGQATAVAFAKAGAKAVYITARSEQALKETQDLIRQTNPDTQCAYSTCDVTNTAQVEAAVSDCVDRFGGIDVADANAGYLDKWAKIGESDPKSWWYAWEAHIKGAYHVIRFSMPYLIESAKRWADKGSSGGHLILLSSIGAQLLFPTASDYQTSKHAINRLCEFVNVDHGQDGIKCFAIHPGGVATELARNMPEDHYSYLTDTPELAAGFIVWLASGKADWATGRFLSANWDVEELTSLKDEILRDDLLVNRLRVRANS